MTNTKYALIAATIAILSLAVVPMQSAEATVFDDIVNDINRTIQEVKFQIFHQIEVSAQNVINRVIVDNHDLIDDQNEFIADEIDEVTSILSAGTEHIVTEQLHQSAEIAGLKADIAELKELIQDLPGKPINPSGR